MFGAIKKRFMKSKPVLVGAVTDEEESDALSNPAFRKILSFTSMFEQIKDDYDINLTDFDSLDDFLIAYISKLDTKGLEVMRRSGNAFMKEAAGAELVSRMGSAPMITDGQSSALGQSLSLNH